MKKFSLYQNIYMTKSQVRSFFGGIGNSTLSDWRKAGFPSPIYLSQKFPLWRRQEVIDWVEKHADKGSSTKNLSQGGTTHEA